MRLIPVIDVLNGVAVRGVAGRRDKYRPVESRLTSSADPIAVARAFRESLGISEIYLADLDAILGGSANTGVYRSLAGAGFQLIVDPGVRKIDAAESVLSCGVNAVVAGLETLSGPGLLAELRNRLPAGRLMFSLDLASGRPLGLLDEWGTSEALEIACRAVDAGIDRMIVLDLAAVGVAEGVSTQQLCRKLRSRYANLEIITGGGVRGPDDLRSLKELGIDGVLVASALHDGRIDRRDVEHIVTRD